MEELTRRGLTTTDYPSGGQEESDDSFFETRMFRGLHRIPKISRKQVYGVEDLES